MKGAILYLIVPSCNQDKANFFDFQSVSPTPIKVSLFPHNTQKHR